jgi:hypothetical protein
LTCQKFQFPPLPNNDIIFGWTLITCSNNLHFHLFYVRNLKLYFLKTIINNRILPWRANYLFRNVTKIFKNYWGPFHFFLENFWLIQFLKLSEKSSFLWWNLVKVITSNISLNNLEIEICEKFGFNLWYFKNYLQILTIQIGSKNTSILKENLIFLLLDRLIQI